MRRKQVKPIDPQYKTIVSNDIFAQAGALGSAIWFFLWCVSRITKELTYEEDGHGTRYGSVLGGLPVRSTDLIQDLQGAYGDRVIREWRKTCVEAGLIRTKRAPNGVIIEVVGSTKFNGTPPERRKLWVSERQNNAYQSGRIMPIIPAQNDGSERQNSPIVNGRKCLSLDSERQNLPMHIEEKGLENKKKEEIVNTNTSFVSAMGKVSGADDIGDSAGTSDACASTEVASSSGQRKSKVIPCETIGNIVGGCFYGEDDATIAKDLHLPIFLVSAYLDFAGRRTLDNDDTLDLVTIMPKGDVLMTYDKTSGTLEFVNLDTVAAVPLRSQAGHTEQVKQFGAEVKQAIGAL